MEPEIQPQIVLPNANQPLNYKKLLIFFLITIIIAAITGFIVWLLMDKQITENKVANTAKVESLQKQVIELKDLNKTVTTNDTTKKTTNTSATMTNDQIYQEVSKQLSLTRGNLGYFRIWGQDRVAYNIGNGGTYAYKKDGTWRQVDAIGQQSVNDCSEYVNVPEAYKPVCTTSIKAPYTTSDTAYMNSEHGAVNYPITSMVSYIGK